MMLRAVLDASILAGVGGYVVGDRRSIVTRGEAGISFSLGIRHLVLLAAAVAATWDLARLVLP